jgi:hypothetical protein
MLNVTPAEDAGQCLIAYGSGRRLVAYRGISYAIIPPGAVIKRGSEPLGASAMGTLNSVTPAVADINVLCDRGERVLHLDFECRASVSIKTASSWRYAADQGTEVLCAAYCVGDGPVELWTPGMPVPSCVVSAATDPNWRVAAHNATFEHAIIKYLLHPRFGWPAIPIDRFVCTMATAHASALPGSLDGAASALGLEVRKDKSGVKLMLDIARRKIEHPSVEQCERLYAYCRRDVEVERELHRRPPPLTEAEQSLWVLVHRFHDADRIRDARGFSFSPRRVG